MAERPRPPEDISPSDFYLKWIPEQFEKNPDQAAKVKDIDAVIQFVLTGEGGGDFVLELSGGKLSTREGKAENPRLTVTMAVPDWREINAGRLNPQMAFMSGKLKVSGDMSLAMKLGSIMGT